MAQSSNYSETSVLTIVRVTWSIDDIPNIFEPTFKRAVHSSLEDSTVLRETLKFRLF